MQTSKTCTHSYIYAIPNMVHPSNERIAKTGDRLIFVTKLGHLFDQLCQSTSSIDIHTITVLLLNLNTKSCKIYS